jgi:hypothetical protein
MKAHGRETNRTNGSKGRLWHSVAKRWLVADWWVTGVGVWVWLAAKLKGAV